MPEWEDCQSIKAAWPVFQLYWVKLEKSAYNLDIRFLPGVIFKRVYYIPLTLNSPPPPPRTPKKINK